MDGVGGLEGWRWIFILEGILTVVLAVGAFFVIYDTPADAKFLTPEEREWITNRTVFRARNAEGEIIEQDDRFRWQYVKDALKDWQVLVAMFMNLGLLVPLYGMSMLFVFRSGRLISINRHFGFPSHNHPGAGLRIEYSTVIDGMFPDMDVVCLGRKEES